MPSLKMRTPEGLTLELELAGAGSRCGAALLDLSLVVGSALALLGVASLLARFDPTGLSAFVTGFLALGGVLLVVLYMILVPIWMQGQTPGKQAFGLRVVGDRGAAASPLAFTLRGMLWLVDMLPLPLPIGLVAISASERRQRFGDLVGGTLVIREPRPSAIARPWPEESWSSLPRRELELAPPHARALSPEDLLLLRDVVTRRGLHEEARAFLYRRTAEHYRQRLGLGSQVSDGQLLKELFLFARETLGA